MAKGLEFSFTWLFAIIAGAFILFLAIFLASKIINLGQTEISVKTGKQIGILLDPLETGFESLESSSFDMPVASRIYNNCSLNGNFGRQLIQVSQQSFGRWTKTNLNVGFSNKYIFSDEYVEGKKFYLFSKPFDFPFKISDLIMMTSSSKSYCFEDAPEQIADEITNINQGNLFAGNCSKTSIKICFSGGTNCDINVDYDNGIVRKNSDTIYFQTDALMYAAIFSNKSLYECQLQRLMKRTNYLGQIYMDKANFISGTGCNTDVNTDLLLLISAADNLKSSSDLNTMKTISDDIQNKNDEVICKLW